MPKVNVFLFHSRVVNGLQPWKVYTMSPFPLNCTCSQWKRTLHFTLILFASLLPLWNESLWSEELENIFGEKWSGTLESVSPQGVVKFSENATPLKLSEMRCWRKAPQLTSASSAKIVATGAQGMRLHLQALAFNGDAFECQLSADFVLKLPFDTLRSVCFEPGRESPAFLAAAEKPPADADKVFVKVEQQIEAVNGLIASISEKELSMEVGVDKRTIPRDRVHGIVLAQASAKPPFIALVHTADGSRIAAQSVALANEQWTMQWLGGSTSTIALDALQRIDFHPAGMKFLSDLDPVAVKEEPIFTQPSPWKRDRSVGGRPLQLAHRVYERGIGVHSRSELTFEIPAEFKLFLATIGIDDEVQREQAGQGSQGHCEFVVLVDGRELFRRAMRGGETPQAIRVEIANAKRLTLLVEPGNDFDFADHADWGDARLLKQIP
jgi:NPCBM/NEW2 domain